MPRREDDLLERDAKRDIGDELLQAIREVKAGRHGARYKVDEPEKPEIDRTIGCPVPEDPHG